MEKDWLKNHPRVDGLLKNKELHFKLELYFEQFLNFAYGIFKIASGVIVGSAWIGADGIYNFTQALIQLFQILRRKKPGTIEKQWKSYRFCGVLILLMHLTLTGIVFQMVNWNRVEESGEIMIIATAAFAFYKFISSFIVLAKDRKHTRPVDSAVRMLELSQAIFAIGHSARDTFRMLLERQVALEPKPFSMGVRIEHKQATIDRAQYGTDQHALPPADYKLVRHLEDGTVYTFCMCPGGYVVAAASEEGGTVTNGMSYADRDGENANAALLVTVEPSEFPYEGPLGGMLWQRELEQAAFRVGGYRAPAQRVGDLMEGRASVGPGHVQPTYRPGVTWCDLHEVLPKKFTTALKQAIIEMDGSLKGFADPDAVLTAPETRSSCPVRIVRGKDRQASLAGFYPAGEGAGYAGGIMSAAIDGMRSAEAVIEAGDV